MNYVDHTQQNEHRILSFATGSGGIERGVKHILPGLRTVAYVEIEAFIVANLVAAMEAGKMDEAPIWSNLKTFDASPFYRKIHGIVGGYPCQPFSLAGQRKGTEDPRHLWPYIHKAIDTAQPLWGFFENVGGHLSMGYDEVYRSLRDLGYSVEAGIFSAAELGATQIRERLFILAVADVEQLRNDMANPDSIGGWILPGKPRKQDSKATTRQSSKILEYPNSFRKRELSLRNEKKQSGLRSSGNEVLGNTNSQGRTAPKQKSQIYGSVTQPGSALLADSNRNGSRKSGQKLTSKQFEQNYIEWPSGPQCKQKEWECPRAVKSGVGCTIDGYNFRRDLLRMYGNGVIWQVAAKAFYSLLQKHIDNFEREQLK